MLLPSFSAAHKLVSNNPMEFLGLSLTVSHNATCLSVRRLNPVVRIFPFDRNTAFIGLVPSWTLSLTLDKTLNIKSIFIVCLSEQCGPELQWRYLEDRAASGVDDPQSLVLADGADSATVRVPADTVDEVWVSVAQLVNQLPSAHIPHTQHIITALRKNEIYTTLDGSADADTVMRVLSL